MNSEKYKITAETYCKLGKKYIDNAAEINLRALPEFMKILPPGGRVLDVGCFGGRDSKKFVDAGFSVTGIDVVDVFIREAKKYAPRAEFLEMDLLEMDFPAGSFDGILAQAVLLHLEKRDIPKALANFHCVLKKGGKVYIGVKRGEGEGWNADKLADNAKRFFSYYTKEEIEGYVAQAGFEIIHSEISPDYVGRDKEWIIVWGAKGVIAPR